MRNQLKLWTAAIAAIFVIALVLVRPAHSQVPTYAPNTIFSGWITNGNFASNINKVIYVGGQGVLALQVDFNYTEAESTNRLYIPFRRSVDGVTYETSATQFMTITNNGTSRMTFVTNITVTGFGYIQIPYVTNFSGVGVPTNLVIKYGVKMSAP